MAVDLVGSWERASLYYANEATWGTAETTGFIRTRESSVCWPYSGAVGPLNAPGGGLGRGLPYEASADFVQGRDGLAFSSTHPMTHLTFADFATLFFNGKGDGSAVREWCGPLDHTDAVVWTAGGSAASDLSATIVAVNDGGAGATSQMQALACMISRLGVSWPQNTPGETGGQVEVSLDWIGNTGTRAASFTHTSTTDTDTQLLTSDFSFEIGGTTYDFLSGDITFTNGATLDPTSNGTSKAASIIFGPIGVTGNVTFFLDEDTSAPHKGADMFLDAWEGKTVLTLGFDYDPADETDDINISLPALVSAKPSISDVGGVAALSFPFTLAGSATAYPKMTIDALESGIFYVAV